MFTVVLMDKRYSWNQMEFVFDTLEDAKAFAQSMFDHYSEENEHDIQITIKMEPIVYDYVEDDLTNLILEKEDDDE